MWWLLLILVAQNPKPLEGRNILFILPHHNFRDEEYQIPKEIFKSLGAEIITASSDTTEAKGMIELTVKPDTLITQVDILDYDAIILVGGSGAIEYWADEGVHQMLNSASDSGKVIGAICLAPVTLAKSGILRNKNATVFETPGTKRIFKKEGVRYTGDKVTRDGNIITANGPRAAKDFAREIITVLTEKTG
jgi:protease I